LPEIVRALRRDLIPNGERMRQREKMFGRGRPRALDRDAKARIMHLARCLARQKVEGRHRGIISRAALQLLQALLWGFHNARSGLCFPSYERIAEAAGCARSTVAATIGALEDAGVLSWGSRQDWRHGVR
jgi:CRP-like cAMP-binding protein